MNEKIKTLETKEEIRTLTTNAESKAEQQEIVKLQIYDLSIFLSVKVTFSMMEHNFF